MLEFREVVVDENMVILGGNQRLKALKALKVKKVPYKVFGREHAAILNKKAKAEGREESTYEEYCDEFVIKDNVSAGTWDENMLGSDDWDINDLEKWGVADWQSIGDIETSDMFNLPDGEKEPFQQQTYHLADEQAAIIKNAIADVKKTEEYKYVETFGNSNTNGNALYLIVNQWISSQN